MDIDGRMGGHRWVDIDGWTPDGWTSDGTSAGSEATLAAMRAKQQQIQEQMSQLIQAHPSFHVLCPTPPMPTDRSDQCTFFVGGSGPEYISIRNFSSCVYSFIQGVRPFLSSDQ